VYRADGDDGESAQACNFGTGTEIYHRSTGLYEDARCAIGYGADGVLPVVF
jgi:hypothetical protein